jgi:putative transcriptional regulator
MYVGFAASALSKKFGICRQTIYAIESGQYLPNTATTLKLARVLQVSVEQLFFLEKKRRASRR